MAYYKCGSVYTTQNSNVVVDTASGAIANFQTPLAMPLLKTRFDFKATQEAGTPTPQSPKAISGVSAVNAVHCHKNLFDLNYLTASGITIQNGEASGTALIFANVFGPNAKGLKNKVKFKANTQYTLKFKAYTDANAETQYVGLKVYFWYTDGNIVSVSCPNNTLSYTDFSVSSHANKTIDYISISYSNGWANTWHLKDIQLEEGASATDFEPYNGSTTLINLGGTYYGGYVSQDKDGKREATITHIAFDDWTNKNVKLYGINTHGIANFSLDHFSQVTKANVGLCNLLTKQTSLYSDTTEEGFLVNPNTQYIRLLNTRASTVDEFKTWATDNNLMIINELETPFTVALPDGQPIKTLPGINNIFADTGDTSLQFRKIG